ncbi:Uu.00g111180.m01.CDS01 [Anthostomella pinea]|uniref:Uu.00g111180.m01.CDS01 n=1 Tax=Anthostomella pinea TaxID=933095 RepID=A0AAI8VF25_9PEZI|nr:Uu.00g111180.m01.CDS01 [Anthostomella pinea]
MSDHPGRSTPAASGLRAEDTVPTNPFAPTWAFPPGHPSCDVTDGGAVDDEDVFSAQAIPRYNRDEAVNFPVAESMSAYSRGQTTTTASLMAAQAAPSFFRQVPTSVRTTRANRSENRHKVEGVDTQIYYSPEACGLCTSTFDTPRTPATSSAERDLCMVATITSPTSASDAVNSADAVGRELQRVERNVLNGLAA